MGRRVGIPGACPGGGPSTVRTRLLGRSGWAGGPVRRSCRWRKAHPELMELGRHVLDPLPLHGRDGQKPRGVQPVLALQLLGEKGPLASGRGSGPNESNIAAALFESEPRPRWWSLGAQHGANERGHCGVQPEHQPRGVLWERKVRVKFGEKGGVRQVVIAVDPGPFERAACQVSKRVVYSCDGKGRKVGGLVGDHPAGQCPGELLSDSGLRGAHLHGPGDRGGVVTPDCCLEVLHWDDLLQ